MCKEERDPGAWTGDPACRVNCSWYKMCPVWSCTFITTGSRQQGRSICGTARKTLEGNANGDDITKRPNDLLVPWLVSEPSVLQFSYHQLLFPQRDKVRTSRRASDSRRKILQQLREKIMTWQNKQGTEVTFNSHPRTYLRQMTENHVCASPTFLTTLPFIRNMNNYYCGCFINHRSTDPKRFMLWKAIHKLLPLRISDGFSLVRGLWCSSNSKRDLWPIKI